MLEPLRAKARGRGPVSRPRKLPVPLNGWFATASMADAPPGSALVLENWFCEPDAIRLRKGSTSHATGLHASAAVESLLVYTSGNATKMFGACSGSIFDVSSSGAVGAAVVAARSNDRIQSTNVATSGGQFLICCNGQDDPWNYNGTVWDLTSGITGVTATGLIDVWQHQQRVWFIESGTTDAWYLATDAITGAATKLPVGSYLSRGGRLMAGASWSVDSGAGMDDLNVIISSHGEIVVFAGTDPADANNWALMGVYQVGHPLGRRCLFKVGGDLLVACEDGVLPLSKIIKLDRAVLSQASLTKDIHPAFINAVQYHEDKFGWQLISKPQANMALLNVPTAEERTAEQFVWNTVTGAASLFTGLNAVCWALFEDDLYFGTTGGIVAKAETGGMDSGVAISAYCLPAFDALGAAGLLKHVKMVQPIFATDMDVAPGITIAVDYVDPGIGSAVSMTAAEGTSVYRPWRTGGKVGTVISPATSVVTVDTMASVWGVSWGSSWGQSWGAGAGTFRLLGYNVVYEEGTVLG